MDDTNYVGRHGALEIAIPSTAVHVESGDPDAASHLLALMDQMAFALVLTDADCAVLYANRAAQTELEGGNGLRSCNACLVASCPAGQAQLQADIDAALQGRRRYRAFSHQGVTSHVAFVPLPCGQRARGKRAALVFDRQAPCDRLAIYFYAHLHGLTGSEERVLGELATGAKVADVALRLDMKPATARAHVRSIIEKTRTGSLRELTARLGGLPPVSARVSGGQTMRLPRPS